MTSGEDDRPGEKRPDSPGDPGSEGGNPEPAGKPEDADADADEPAEEAAAEPGQPDDPPAQGEPDGEADGDAPTPETLPSDGTEEEEPGGAQTGEAEAGAEHVPEPARTIVQPAPPAEVDTGDAPDQSAPPAPRTIVSPAPPTGGSDSPPEAAPRTIVQPHGNAAPTTPQMPPAGAGRVSVGDVLNHIYKIDRFIARGGMGEVYEGHNVSSDETVAIKVILPHLAADASVQAMFLKEARTLTRLQHPALVQYRLLAQEPELGVLYIATEFIDGKPLSELLGTVKGDVPTLTMLVRRLAEGLSAAHALGAIHRDLAPDNILLPDNRLDLAKIIDFGIAKDLDTSKGTIVGDGFAGKLNYVAPEQLGDFGREVGPWTDVYSLGLVILAIVRGRDVDMGATLVEAVDRRREEPDLSIAPAELRPLLAAMLQANPVNRLRSMADVIKAVDDPSSLPPLAEAAPREDAGARTVFQPLPGQSGESAADGDPSAASGQDAQRRKRMAFIGGGALAGIAVVALAISLLSGGGDDAAAPGVSGPPGATGSEGEAAAPAVPDAERARAAIAAKLGSISCSWLDLESVSDTGAGVQVAIEGVASNPVSAERQISDVARQAGVRLTSLDLSAVAPIGESMCRPLDVFRSIRADTSMTTANVKAAQRFFEIAMQNSGQREAKAVIELQVPQDGSDFTLVGLEPSGRIEIIPGFTNRAEFLGIAGKSSAVQDMGGGRYRIEFYTDHSGWSGLLLITGKQPFPASVIAPPRDARTATWPESFAKAAEQGGWRGEMEWYKTVDARPD